MHRLRFVSVVLAVALGLLGAGCGSDDKAAAGAGPGQGDGSAADRACRARWHALGRELGDKAVRGVLVRRAFETRWDSIGAGIGYYESTADADQCGDLLTTARTAIGELDAVVALALPYDLEQRATAAAEDRTTWRTEHPTLQRPKPVRAAYRTLRSRVARAGQDLSPAITELAAVDPGRIGAVSRGLEDLALLAGTSEAYLACNDALAKVTAFVHPRRSPPQGRDAPNAR